MKHSQKRGPLNPSVLQRYVFHTVIEHYVEAKFTSGHVSQFHYENRQQRPQNDPHIRPSMCDFVCDVEIAAKAVLSAVEITLLCNKYLHGVTRPVPERMQRHIEEVLGEAFIARHIYPINEYFRPKLISPTCKKTHQTVGFAKPTTNAGSTHTTRNQKMHHTSTRGNSDQVAPTTNASCF